MLYSRARKICITLCLALLVVASIFMLMPYGCGGGSSSGGTASGGGDGGSIVTPTPTPSPSSTVSPTPTPTPSTWLSYVNFYRGLALLSSATENTTYDAGCLNHATYMVKNNYVGHSEDPSLPYYTPEGNAAGHNSDVMGTTDITETDMAAIDTWMSGPFHALGIIKPNLLQVGYGAFREAHPGGIQMAAALDINSGAGTLTPTAYPIRFPADGSTTMPILSFQGGESPDPIGAYGYTAPTGPAIMIQLSPGMTTPSVTAHSFSQGGTALNHICFDETNYTNADATAQALGRSILHGLSAIVIMPQSPLTAGTTYSVSITSGGTVNSWTFTTSGTAHGRKSGTKSLFN
jgi:hypothetical protein